MTASAEVASQGFSVATPLPFMVFYAAPIEIASLGNEICSSEVAVASSDLTVLCLSCIVNVVQGSVMTVLVTSKTCSDKLKLPPFFPLSSQ